MIALLVVIAVALVIWGAVALSKRRHRDAGADTPPSITFEVGYGPDVGNGAGRAVMEWSGPGSSLRVAGLELVSPFTYHSNGAPSTREPSCIDTTLQASGPVDGPDERLGYWPSYSGLSPSQRAYYLTWLANGRTNPAREVGYAFIFFYGLERRALIDEKDVDEVATEVRRMLPLHSTSGSFRYYASSFLRYLDARQGRAHQWDRTSDSAIDPNRSRPDIVALELALAGVYQTGRPLPVSLALEVARSDIRSTRSVVVTRVAQQFGELFQHKYAARFGAGLTLRAASRNKTLGYSPASNAIRASDCRPVDYADVLGVQSQFKPVVALWNECIEELRPLSREVAKGKSVDSTEAYFALPDELRAVTEHPDKTVWEHFVNEHATDGNVVISQASELAALCRYAVCKRLTRKQSDALAATATAIGFVLVPDSRTTGRSYGWEEPVALFRIEGAPIDPADRAYRTVVMMTEIGIAVAAADGVVDREEASYISEFLGRQFSLTAEQLRYTDAYRELLVSKPPSLSEITRRLRSMLHGEPRETVGRFMVGIAAANRQVTEREVASLRRLYTALGADPAKVDEQLTQYTSGLAQVVEIQGESGDAVTERIPPKADVVFTLSPEAVRAVMEETEQVAKILGAVLDGDTDNADSSPTAVSPQCDAAPAEQGEYRGLDARHCRLVAVLIAQSEWTKEQFAKLAREGGCMPAAALETINSWSDEQFGDFLIEEGDTYRVNQGLIRRT